MPLVLPTIEQIEDYLESVEELIVSSLSAATPDLPKVSETINRLWQDVLRHSPQAVPSSLKGLGAFEVPPPPPPPPPPKGFWESTADWVADHPWTTAGISVGFVGAGLLVGYAHPRLRHRTRIGARKHAAAANTERRQVIVVLGGDSPLGLPLILDLEKKGYIVITSVATPEAVDEIESKAHGYVRVLVLDPTEPEMVPFFLRSLASTMSRRFPLTAAGDPHAAPTTHLFVQSVISLLTLPSSTTVPPPAPLEHLNLRGTYQDYLQATHIVPLQVLQALLPLLRSSPARARDALSSGAGQQSIVVCLPATDARVGLPFGSAQAMSAAATLRGVEVLRREIRAASSSGTTGTAEAMRNIRVVVVDVGAVGEAVTTPVSDAALKSVDQWTPAEQAAYGPAFGSLLEHGTRREPSDVSVFVDTVVDVVSNGRKSGRACRSHPAIGRLRQFVRGDRIAVGAGAHTYAFASYLPPLLLDALLNIPYFLASIRNALLPVPPRVILPPRVAAAAQPPPPPPASVVTAAAAEKQPEPTSGTDSEHEHSETGSEADVESNSGVGESWVPTSTQAISLWLVPNEETRRKIETAMKIGPPTTNSPSSFPPFQPHVTLASSSDPTALRAAVPRDQPAIPVSFKSLEVGEKYFMSVFVAVHSAHGSPLETLREHLRASLGDAAVPPVAHLSLYYIDKADKGEREYVARRLKSELRVLEGGRGDESVVKIACFYDDIEEEQDPELIDGFDGEEIWLVRCKGPVPSWEVLQKFILAK
ncbi:hypothetical protein L226DRAFT_555675 [Lentinus tigrinus ALCF2SS1-7]|uniref:uncharacterized protein n=1 Tax=Lentinus tigrinus ALCF2SS1-7 TaxID=1328758 RepID=UPI0011662536|nr:hypothetical protein L226DRAFT_555675 [Lentinus tigrinus ALCF2SS1-7]